MRKLIIAIDFDRTIAMSNYPNIIGLMNYSKFTINKWAEQGHTIVINTCRAEAHADVCRDFLGKNDITYHYFNENPRELIKRYETDTRKMSADVYFDDKNAGGFMGWRKADEYVQWKANRKPIIICLVGESGSGKSTLEQYIQYEFAVPMIESYTTRPRRSINEEGHAFISDADFDAFKDEDKIAETKFGDYRYCCLKSDVQEENTYVIDEDGLEHLRANFDNDFEIKSIRVRCGESERIERAGRDRVSRDKGRFVLKDYDFDYVWHTDSWRDKSPRRQKEYEDLENTIRRWLNRGWS